MYTIHYELTCFDDKVGFVGSCRCLWQLYIMAALLCPHNKEDKSVTKVTHT
jgi:hypothetical protein